eukprot:GHVT01004517.1.p1 GENE.GHVT01004517.1~~GHVT01004517.1.p1  ORF type:complete len:526 (+),score=50.00 GHVT01004517.1:308-1885(+)
MAENFVFDSRHDSATGQAAASRIRGVTRETSSSSGSQLDPGSSSLLRKKKVIEYDKLPIPGLFMSSISRPSQGNISSDKKTQGIDGLATFPRPKLTGGTASRRELEDGDPMGLPISAQSYEPSIAERKAGIIAGPGGVPSLSYSSGVFSNPATSELVRPQCSKGENSSALQRTEEAGGGNAPLKQQAEHMIRSRQLRSCLSSRQSETSSGVAMLGALPPPKFSSLGGRKLDLSGLGHSGAIPFKPMAAKATNVVSATNLTVKASSSVAQRRDSEKVTCNEEREGQLQGNAAEPTDEPDMTQLSNLLAGYSDSSSDEEETTEKSQPSSSTSSSLFTLAQSKPLLPATADIEPVTESSHASGLTYGPVIPESIHANDGSEYEPAAPESLSRSVWDDDLGSHFLSDKSPDPQLHNIRNLANRRELRDLARAEVSSISIDSLRDPNWAMTSTIHAPASGKRKPKAEIVTKVWSAQTEKTETTNEPRKMQKRKHQINWLAHEAQEKEMDLLERTAHTRQSKYQTQMKYGW